jgi:hypothetical protein
MEFFGWKRRSQRKAVLVKDGEGWRRLSFVGEGFFAVVFLYGASSQESCCVGLFYQS